ncbi:MAG: hypothetical protein CMK03_11230, partial [Ponticaulis sp.]|nr:hypothetical protein [Ponticaulis sp.]
DQFHLATDHVRNPNAGFQLVEELFIEAMADHCESLHFVYRDTSAEYGAPLWITGMETYFDA